MAEILIVDDEESFRRVLVLQTKRFGHTLSEATNGREAWDLIKSRPFNVVVTDLKMPEMDGLELLQRIRRDYPQIPVVMITAHGTIDTAVEAMKRGAFDYITKPFSPDDYAQIIQRALEAGAAQSKEFQRSRSFLRQEEKIIGTTDEMEKIYSIVENVAQGESSVLITGEVGTGKDIIARLLHDKSERRANPLVMASLSACPESQQEAALFGTAEKPGWLELAEGGTVYFDEIGALSLENQSKLYNALVQRFFYRQRSKLDLKCRVIAASDFNLLEKIATGTFRKDLFYHLNVVPIYLPSLRERTQDIEPLCDHFIKRFSKKFNKQTERLSDEALFHLIAYPWPGNIRELENCMEYAVNLCDSSVIEKQHLPPHLFGSPLQNSKSWAQTSHDVLRHRVEALEKTVIEDALKSSRGDILKASQKLGVPPSLLQERASSLKIPSTR